jgi:hypothetical protein
MSDSVVTHPAEGCLQVRCLAMESPLPIVGQECFFAGTCLLSCSLVTDIHVTVFNEGYEVPYYITFSCQLLLRPPGFILMNTLFMNTLINVRFRSFQRIQARGKRYFLG